MGSRCSSRAIKENLEGERGSAIKRPELKMNQDLRKGREGRVLLPAFLLPAFLHRGCSEPAATQGCRTDLI